MPAALAAQQKSTRKFIHNDEDRTATVQNKTLLRGTMADTITHYALIE